MLLGSVSRYSATHASCPVTVVRQENRAVPSEVAVGLRDPDDTTRTLAFAFEEAALRDATLVAVHSSYSLPSAPSGPRPSEAAAADAEQVSAKVSQDLADALGRWQDKYPRVPVRLDVVHGHPARMLASYSERADLVVIGRHGGQVTGPAIGAIQLALLQHARGPVTVVPSEG
jgi:nucleotide-binding universal stress UspA family protein